MKKSLTNVKGDKIIYQLVMQLKELNNNAVTCMANIVKRAAQESIRSKLPFSEKIYWEV